MALTLAFLTGLFAGGIDLSIALSAAPAVHAHYYSLIPALTTTALITTAGFILFWYLFLSPLQRIVGGSREKSLAMSYSVSVLLIMGVAIHRYELSKTQESIILSYSVLALFTLFFSCICFIPPPKKAVFIVLGAATCFAGFALAGVSIAWFAAFRDQHSYWSGAINLLTGIGISLLILLLLLRSTLLRQRIFPIVGLYGILITTAAFLLVKENRDSVPSFPDTEEHNRPDKVFLIVIDTLRADALSCYDPEAPPTTAIDSLAGDGILFERAMAPSGWTLPSVSTLVTGLAPQVHNADTVFSHLPGSFKTIGDYFKSDGYYTSGVGTNVFLRRGLTQGFEYYDVYPKGDPGRSAGDALLGITFRHDLLGYADAERLTNLAIHAANELVDQPHLLWVHYFDPHFPAESVQDSHNEHSLLKTTANIFRREDTFPDHDTRQRITTLYYDEVQNVDTQLERFFDKLRSAGLYDESLIILTSDHGEELWDHNAVGHSHTLYQELLHVPLIIKLPGNMSGGTRFNQLVGLQDVLPTILDISDIAYDPETISGRSLRPLWEEDRPDEQMHALSLAANVSGAHKHALIIDKMKFMLSSSGRSEVYDLSLDSEEQNNLASEHTTEIEQARETVKQLLDEGAKLRARLLAESRIEEDVNLESAPDIDAEEIQQLRSLGYIN